MFRRFFQSIKNFIRGPPRPISTEEISTQSNYPSQVLDSSTMISPSTVFVSAVSSEKVKSHCPIHDSIVSTPTSPLAPSLEPEKPKPAASDASSPPPPYAETPLPSAPETSVDVPYSLVWDMPDLDAAISDMVNNMMGTTMKFSENISNLYPNLAGVAGHTNGNVLNVNYNSDNGTASFLRELQQSNGSSSYSHSTSPSSSSGFAHQPSGTAPIFTSSSTPDGNSHISYLNNGAVSRGVFVTTNGGYMANVGNTISIFGGSQSTGSSSYGYYGETNVWNVGSPHISTHSGSLSVDVVNDTVVVNGRKYPKKQGLGPLGHLTEITAEGVVVDGHVYYPECKSS